MRLLFFIQKPWCEFLHDIRMVYNVCIEYPLGNQPRKTFRNEKNETELLNLILKTFPRNNRKAAKIAKVIRYKLFQLALYSEYGSLYLEDDGKSSDFGHPHIVNRLSFEKFIQIIITLKKIRKVQKY